MNQLRPKVFLAPISNNDLSKNYQKTIICGFLKADFLEFKNASQYENLLSKSHFIRTWGIKRSKLTPFNKASKDDVVLFYHKGLIIGKAIISFKDNNKILSEELWGYDRRKITGVIEYWENILFLESFNIINLDFKILIEFASYSNRASVRGFNEYSKYGTDNILLRYSSIDKFLQQYK